MCGEEPTSVLETLLLSQEPDRFRKAQTFIRAQALSPETVAELVSSALVQALMLDQDLQQPGETRGRIQTQRLRVPVQ